MSVRRLLLLAAAVVLVGSFAVFVLADSPTAPPFVAPPLRPIAQRQTPVALFIGDSYVAGTGASAGRPFFATTGSRLGWIGYGDGEGSTGFVTQGHQISQSNTPYSGRLQADRGRYVPNVAVVTGGRNDELQPTGTVVTAADRYLRDVHAAFPKARLIIVAPFWSDSHPPATILALRDQERSTAADLDATFVDPLAEGWITDQNAAQFIGPDHIHPTQTGHDYLGTRLAEVLR